MFLEHLDKDFNFASQCTLCGPLTANGVNNYRAYDKSDDSSQS